MVLGPVPQMIVRSETPGFETVKWATISGDTEMRFVVIGPSINPVPNSVVSK